MGGLAVGTKDTALASSATDLGPGQRDFSDRPGVLGPCLTQGQSTGYSDLRGGQLNSGSRDPRRMIFGDRVRTSVLGEKAGGQLASTSHSPWAQRLLDAGRTAPALGVYPVVRTALQVGKKMRHIVLVPARDLDTPQPSDSPVAENCRGHLQTKPRAPAGPATAQQGGQTQGQPPNHQGTPHRRHHWKCLQMQSLFQQCQGRAVTQREWPHSGRGWGSAHGAGP